MWKVFVDLRFTLLNRKFFDISRLKHVAINKRFFLSEAYRCREAWDRRLKAPILQNIKLDEFYQELEGKFNSDGKATAIDVDLFANKVNNESYIDELEDLLHKLRLSPNTTDTLPSTHHSVIRFYLDLGKYDELLRILDDRLNYGIFPDDYCSALLMDTFLKEKNYTAAIRVSVLQMLQEDWDNPVISHLALIASYMYLKNPVSWVDTSEAEKPEDDGEEIKVRVDYLRNPYFDDHFDIRDPKLLVGKTLATLGETFPDAVGKTYQLIGWGMYQKWEKALSLLQDIFKEKQKTSLFREGIEIFKESLKELKEEDSSENEIKNKISKLLQDIESLGLVNEDNLLEHIESKVKSVVAAKEKQMIEEQCKAYSEWELLRENLLKQQLNELRRVHRLAKVEEEKAKLQKREQVIFFFDNEEKWELAIEKKEEEKRLKEQKLQKLGKLKQKDRDEDYIPPDVKAARS